MGKMLTKYSGQLNVGTKCVTLSCTISRVIVEDLRKFSSNCFECNFSSGVEKNPN